METRLMRSPSVSRSTYGKYAYIDVAVIYSTTLDVKMLSLLWRCGCSPLPFAIIFLPNSKCPIFHGFHLASAHERRNTKRRRRRRSPRRKIGEKCDFLVSSDVLLFPLCIRCDLHIVAATYQRPEWVHMCANSISPYFFLCCSRIASLFSIFCARCVSFVLFFVLCSAKHLPKIHSCINNNTYIIYYCVMWIMAACVSSVRCVCVHTENSQREILPAFSKSSFRRDCILVWGLGRSDVSAWKRSRKVQTNCMFVFAHE